MFFLTPCTASMARTANSNSFLRDWFLNPRDMNMFFLIKTPAPTPPLTEQANRWKNIWNVRLIKFFKNFRHHGWLNRFPAGHPSVFRCVIILPNWSWLYGKEWKSEAMLSLKNLSKAKKLRLEF